MKCQSCDKPGTLHVTDIVAGKPVEYHVCETHFQDLDALEPASGLPRPATGFAAFWDDVRVREALQDKVAREKIAAHLLPALALALLDENPQVRLEPHSNWRPLGPTPGQHWGHCRTRCVTLMSAFGKLHSSLWT
jgi:hypothetical protein